MSSIHRLHDLFSRRGRGLREAAFASTAGVITAYGEPGVGFAPLFLVGLVALAFLAARARSVFAAACLGVLYGASMFAVIMVSSANWGAIVPVALTLAGVALYGMPLALWSRWASRHLHGWALFAATIAAWALCMDVGDIVGFPSKCEALSAVAFAPALMGGCRLVGTNVVCGILMAGAVCSGVALARLQAHTIRSTTQALAPLGASLLVLLAVSTLAHVTARPPSGSVSVGVPQLNIPTSYFKLRQALPEQTDRLEELLSKQVSELGDVDLLAFTETYDGAFPLLVPRLRERFQNHARLQQQAILLTSYLVTKAGGGINAVGAINARGQLVGVHRKVNLAPFGEAELEPGAGFHALPVLSNAKVGVLICQEALLADGPRALTRDGAALLVTTTSDISFGSGILSFGHLAAGRLRAIEVGRSMVWASNGGPSGTITRWGEFQTAAPFRSAAAAKMRVETFDDTARFLHGTALWPALCAATLLFLGLRKRSPNAAPSIEPPRLGTLRGLLELSLSLSLVAITSVGSPAVVELSSGEGSRARQAVLELLGRVPADTGGASLARFHTDAAHTAQGAIAYYLDYYGERRLPNSITLAQPKPTLQDVARELAEAEHFPTREVRLDFSAPPRAGALVRSKAGELGVLSSNSLKEIGVFLSTQDGLSTFTYDQARVVLEPTALLPTNDPSLE